MSIDLKNFLIAFRQIAEEKRIPEEMMLSIVESALASAYKKDYGKKGEIIKCKIDMKTGNMKFWKEKIVVDENDVKENGEKISFNPLRHITVEEAKNYKKDAKPGDIIKFDLENKLDFGRIAAQTARQVILQKIKETERTLAYEEYKEKEGDIISGIVQRIEKNLIWVDIGRVLAILPKKEQVPGEFYKPGQKMKFYVLSVENTPKGPVVYISRTHPKLVSRLFYYEVPELQNGVLEIKSIAREPGSRTKIAVVSHDENIDPIGAMVGQKGARVSVVMQELGQEKIDIVKWSEDPKEYVANALSPAKVSDVKIVDESKVLVIVPEDQFSLAIGKEGQNVRLAAKLTCLNIDIISEEDVDKKNKKIVSAKVDEEGFEEKESVEESEVEEGEENENRVGSSEIEVEEGKIVEEKEAEKENEGEEAQQEAEDKNEKTK